ncbi:MAG TPA: hypothetical protein VF221_22965 [Chloroflexota bacterium]
MAWIVAGFFFSALWARFLWRRPWARTVKLLILTLYVIAQGLTLRGIVGVPATVTMTILTIVTLAVIVRSPEAQPEHLQASSGLSRFSRARTGRESGGVEDPSSPEL